MSHARTGVANAATAVAFTEGRATRLRCGAHPLVNARRYQRTRDRGPGARLAEQTCGGASTAPLRRDAGIDRSKLAPRPVGIASAYAPTPRSGRLVVADARASHLHFALLTYESALIPGPLALHFRAPLEKTAQYAPCVGAPLKLR